MADRKTAPRFGWPWRPVRRQVAARWRPGRVGALRAIPADRHVAARGPTKTSQTRQTGRPRHRLVGLRRHISDVMCSLTLCLVVHPMKILLEATYVERGGLAGQSLREPHALIRMRFSRTPHYPLRRRLGERRTGRRRGGARRRRSWRWATRARSCRLSLIHI